MPCHLHLEHLNRQLKGSLRNLRSNIDRNCINRAARSIGVVHSIDLEFGKELTIALDSDQHHRPSFTKDVNKVATVLQEIEPFKYVHNRKFKSFKNKKPLLDTMDKDEKIVDWMVEKVAPLIF